MITAKNVALASNYLLMRRDAIHMLKDIDEGRELNPSQIVHMFPWADSVQFLRGLVQRRLDECDANLSELGVSTE